MEYIHCRRGISAVVNESRPSNSSQPCNGKQRHSRCASTFEKYNHRAQAEAGLGTTGHRPLRPNQRPWEQARNLRPGRRVAAGRSKGDCQNKTPRRSAVAFSGPGRPRRLPSGLPNNRPLWKRSGTQFALLAPHRTDGTHETRNGHDPNGALESHPRGMLCNRPRPWMPILLFFRQQLGGGGYFD